MNNTAVKGWKSDESDIHIECAGTSPSSLKYVFAEINTKTGNFLIFLRRPTSCKFVILEYGKYGVEELKLFGYQTVTEDDLASL